jgi:spore maturation protein CgeB
MKFVICGLSITSAWGNGHATTYRALVRELGRLGHEVLFLEADRPWYAGNRDLPDPPFGRTELYRDVAELRARFARDVREADVVIVGSYVPDGVAVGHWVTESARGVRAFYDIDTPVTLAKLARGDREYLSPELIPRYDLYLSFTGGPTLRTLERRYGSPRARALYCSVDVAEYYPEPGAARWDLGYLGTYSDDRQPTLERLLVEPARRWAEGRFVVAGALYPEELRWAPNVERITHLAPREHRRFYNSLRYALNVTRHDMVAAGWSPSVRLFEAAACGTPILSDWWEGLDSIFVPDREILIARSTRDAMRVLRELPERRRRDLGRRAREKVLAHHTSAHRAAELVACVAETYPNRRKTWKLPQPRPFANPSTA